MLSHDSIVWIGKPGEADRYTIGEMLKNMKHPPSENNASLWAGRIMLAMKKPGDFSQVIFDEITCTLGNICAETIVPESTNSQLIGGAVEPPAYLDRGLFKPIKDNYPIDVQRLWKWLYEVFVRNIQFQYEWLAPLLFFDSQQLIEKNEDKAWAQQMSKWYPEEYTKYVCSEASLHSYHNGFFRSTDFIYKKWINLHAPVPPSYKFKKDQREDGFKRIHTRCLYLEGDFELGKIAVKDRNRQ